MKKGSSRTKRLGRHICLLPQQGEVRKVIPLRRGSESLIEFPPDIEEKMRDIACEFGLDEGETLSMAIQFTHRAMEIRREGKGFIAAITNDHRSFRRLEPKPFLERYG